RRPLPGHEGAARRLFPDRGTQSRRRDRLGQTLPDGEPRHGRGPTHLVDADVSTPAQRSEDHAMAMSLYELSSETFAPMLRALSDILDKGIEHAHAHGLGERELPEARLAPDMYTLTQQVQLACSNALEGVARVTGREETRLPNDERTLDDLKRCIARTIE